VLAQRVEHIAVYARVKAEHQLRIVRAWKVQGAVVAMTGTGSMMHQRSRKRRSEWLWGLQGQR